MTTASTSAVLSQALAANYQAWVQEIYTNLVTNCGLVQTNDTGQAAVPFAASLPVGTGIGNANGYYLFTFNDTLAGGGLSTTALNAAGSGYTNSSYTNLTVTGATSGANNARASCTVSGGAAGNLTITTAGSGYIVGEKLTVTGIGSGTLANWTATALSSGVPVIFRLDFGGGAATTDPQMWITVGQGTNGAGTIAGSAATTKMTQVACFCGAVPASLVTAYTSRYVWNSTYGFCGLAFKYGAVANACIGGFLLYRSNDSTGAATGSAIILISNNTTTTGSTTVTAVGAMQCLVPANSVVYPTLNASNSLQWAGGGGTASIMPFTLSSTLFGSNTNVIPTYYMQPALSFSAYVGLGLASELSIGSTASLAIVGSTPLTFISAGAMFGATGLCGFSIGSADTVLMLWQ